MVSAALLGVVGFVTFGVLHSSMILSGQNLGVNLSSFRGRQMIDRVDEHSRYGMAQPALINTDGTANASGAADGILVKRLVGSPYVVKNSDGTTADIPATATSFVIEYWNQLPDPQAGDFILMETIQRPELEISAVTNLTANGSVLRKQITTTIALGEVAKPSQYRVGGTIYKKEAFVFAAYEAGANPRCELRHFSRVRGTTNFSTASNYYVMANGFRKLNGQSFFTNATSNNVQISVLRALVHSSGKQEIVERNSTVSSSTTVPVQLRIWTLER
jgi:hypothetical protein